MANTDTTSTANTVIEEKAIIPQPPSDGPLPPIPMPGITVDPLHGPTIYYADFDANNNVKGFYNNKIYPNGKGIPSTAIVITEAQWENFIGKQGSLKWNGKDDFVEWEKTITVDDLLDYSSSYRRNIEEGGITLNGTAIATDRNSQQMIQQTITSLSLVPDLVIDWKNPDRTFTTLSGDQVKAIGSIVATFVSQTFTIQKAVTDLITSGKITTNIDIEQYYDTNVTKVFKA